MPTNPALSSGQMLPGFYGHADYGQTVAAAPNRRVLIWGFMGASATATPNKPFLPTDETDAVNRLGSANCDAARFYRALLSQPEGQGCEAHIMPIVAPSGGTAATYVFTVYVANTNPSKAGSLQIWIASQMIGSVSYTTTDTATTIGAAIAAAILANTYVPVATCTASTGVITITYLHKGTTGEDFPVRCLFPILGTGVNFSPCQLLFAANATGAGSVSVQVGAITITTALAGGETPAAIATKVAASINADTYPVTAVVDGSVPAQVDLYFNNGWDVRRVTASILTSTGTTVNAGSGVTDGTGSANSTSTNGAIGSGAPSIAAAITNLTNQKKWYRKWMAPWTDTTTLGTMASYIEAASDGSISGQKLQTLVVADWRALAVAGPVPAAVSPNLTSTPPHYAYGWCIDAPVQVAELAARVAGAMAAIWLDAPQKNWNGFKFQGTPNAPILAPAYTPSELSQNSALRTYGLSPWCQGPSGNIEVVKGRTTSLAADLRLWAWSAETQAAYHIVDLLLILAAKFSAGSLVRYSDPKAPGIFDNQSFIDVTNDALHKWEREGNYDGADLLAPLTTAVPNRVNVFREDVDFAESPVLDLDQVVFESHFTQPSS